MNINFFVIHKELSAKKINVHLTPLIDQINVDLTPIMQATKFSKSFKFWIRCVNLSTPFQYKFIERTWK